ncbi:DoxX family protein [Christiangramia sabulilitoris]|uniref:DoxX family protein n=1 Tax=Christiangramia sabulilitoris TaxID=2583991 RepID=A0A550I684_9FLAO|nr:DoxX family protein [Christiangramia sabulilitoris]TRO66486.1 DoxX family protein [Christiangramia sabulilitoris]
MDYISIALQLIVGLSILNVWLIQYNKSTQWRGGNATTLKEEFAVYGMPEWSLYLIGFLKVTLAIALIAGIWYPELVNPSALGLAFLLAGSVFMHIKINDPLKKSIPALLFLILCLLIVFVV